MMDSQRKEGVTCLNGKYVYVRKMKDGSRPVVSTVLSSKTKGFDVVQNFLLETGTLEKNKISSAGQSRINRIKHGRNIGTQ